QGMNNAAGMPTTMVLQAPPQAPVLPSVYQPAVTPPQTLAPVGIPGTPAMVPPLTSNPSVPNGGVSLLTVGETVTISWADLPPQAQWVDVKTRIGDDGRIILPFNVSVVAAGKTANQLAQDIRNEYVPKYFVRITPTVKTEERFYFVGGEVKIPSRMQYLGEMTVLRAIDTAGGFTDFASR